MNNELFLAWGQLFTFAFLVEAATESIPYGLKLIPWLGRYILDRVTSKQLSFITAISTTIIFRYGVMEKIVGIPAETDTALWTDYILTGLIVSRGSEFIHTKFKAALLKAEVVKKEKPKE